ncbi:hypothetical protein FVEG_05523 [Fusarium verticillioides 7600]|uniref:Uncharacterized protein n=1 Tax=Gibberella moniliformis (strain M3125 / FGSC 7600) TaxID=334819 RepID=W7MAJ3_GIBM7|nr:hypothetical protein FVEG_05523 [Fusarium verticillioides 7600]EWG44479.1 hypothetical protein FVEG_05523 [Fusarium verticillioides 7600]RBQ68262.1 hypothetical protein FVER14953_05523 [Fusarium verticillioides]RBQ91282.1 hypothetical protein FVER53263_05523 [Fusarium verticillioides]
MAIVHGFQTQIFRLLGIRTKYPGYSKLIYDGNGKIISCIYGPKIQPRVFKKPDTVFYKQAKPSKKMSEEYTGETDIIWRIRENRGKKDP